MSHENILGGVVLGLGTRKYKGPPVGACPVCLRTSGRAVWLE